MSVDLRSTQAYRYDLPEERIARFPAEPRESARLLVVGESGFEDRVFADFPSLLRAGDVLVINQTRVIRARLRATREPGGGAAEVLLLRPVTGDRRFDPQARVWQALVKPGRRMRPGARVRFGDAGAAEVVGMHTDGVREIAFELRVSFEELLERYGEMPLPPYVGPGDEARALRYQTVFAKTPGSVAAPTASLHFSEEILRRIRERGVSIVPVVLDIGLGTFKPIEAESIDAHLMHAERYAISEEAAAAIAAAKREGRRVVAAGTTVLRCLEASAQRHGAVRAEEGETNLYVTPGFAFRAVDALLTNFHLPASTLLVLICAFAGYERTMAAYRHAIDVGYRFYSFGDAMLVGRC